MVRLLLVTDAIGGVWVYSLELARALKPLGVETLLVVMGPSPDAEKREEAGAFRLIDSGLPLEWLDTSPGELRRAGAVLAGIAEREDVDILQTSSAALLADTKIQIPCIAVQHSCLASWWAAVRPTPPPPEFEWRRDLVLEGLTRADVIVAPSLAFAEETSRIYDLPVACVHNGRRWIPTPDVPQRDFVLTAGRLWDEGKNFATLDRAAARLAVPVEAAGPAEGPNGARVGPVHAKCLGTLSEKRLSSLYATRPVYASAALYEPFGLSVLEAAQAGCALVLSDIPTHREIWGGAAVFVPPRNDRAFADAIDDLFADPDEREELGQLARARGLHYSSRRMARAMADIYASVVAPAQSLAQVAGVA